MGLEALGWWGGGRREALKGLGLFWANRGQGEGFRDLQAEWVRTSGVFKGLKVGYGRFHGAVDGGFRQK